MFCMVSMHNATRHTREMINSLMSMFASGTAEGLASVLCDKALLHHVRSGFAESMSSQVA